MVGDIKILNRFSRIPLKNNLNVGLGEIAIGESDICLRVPALGSCIALVIYIRDLPQESRIAMMAHVVYPHSTQSVNPHKDVISRGKYADIAISKMIWTLERRGFQKKEMVAKMAGGVESIGNSKRLNVKCSMNAPAIIELLKQEKIPLKSSYTGGSERIEAVFRVREYKLHITPKGAQTIIL